MFTNSYSQIDKRVLVKVAENYLGIIGTDQSIDKDIKTISSNDTILAYVVELNPKGFIVLTPSKSLHPLLAYSFEDDFNFEESPYNTLLNMIRGDMRHQLDLIENTNKKSLRDLYQENEKKWNTKEISNRVFEESYGPYLPDVWGQVNCKDQDSVYIYVTNYFTPNHYAVGCVAMSMAQIMHYYKWPYHGQGAHTNYDNSGSSQGTYSANFDTTYYDWSNMLNEYMYKVSTDDERRATGNLTYQFSVAYDMDYEYNGSTASISDSPSVLDNYFRGSCHYQYTSWSSFWDRFDENIENGHPLQLDIRDAGFNGHAPVCDGYGVLDNNPDIDERYYHLNMGWWGGSNAWYRLRGTFNAGGYTSINAAVFDILPDPEFVPMEVQNSNIFTLKWNIADNLVCDSFEIQKYISGTWTTIGKTSIQEYTDTVEQCGNYQYQVRAKTDGHWYSDSYSEAYTVFVEGDITALEFDGNDSYYVQEQDDLLDVTGSDWTIETWVYPTLVPASGSFPAILSRKYSFELYFRNTSGNLGVGIVAFDGSGTGFDIEATLTSLSGSMSLNTWHHIAVSRSGSTTRLFIDGTQVGYTSNSNFDLDESISALNIGARYDGSYIRYIDECRLDEIRYSKVARYTSNFTPHHYDLNVADSDDILLMHLDEGIGYDITDESGNFEGIELRSSPNSPNWVCDANYNAYYVDATLGDDSNPGSETLPWQTINKVNTSSFEPGDHIKFKKGESWNEYFYFNQNNSGTEHAPIVIEAYGSGNNPLIIHEDFGAILTGCSYLTLQNFEITSDIGIMIKDDSGTNPSTGIKLLNNKINDTNANGNVAVGIYLSDGANNCLIENNEVEEHHVGIWTGEDSNAYEAGCENIYSKNNIHDNQFDGISFSKTNCTVGTESIVSDNTIYNNGFHGIALDCRYYIAEYNLVYDNGQDSQGGSSGIHTYSRASDEGVSEDKGGDHNVIRYNTIYGTQDRTTGGARTDGNGIQMDMWCDSNKIYNNIIYNNDGAGIILYGASDNEVYNNTMYGNGQDLGVRFGKFEMTVMAAQLSGSNGSGWLHSENNTVKNNIGMAVGAETSRFGATICDLSILDNNIFENNDWYNDSDNRHVGIVDLTAHTTNEKTITEWNNYTWTSNELAINPLFVDAVNHDYTLDHNSPAIDIGQDLTSVDIDDDFNNKPRPLLANFDAGAMEHGVYWIGKYSSSWSNKDNWNNGLVPDNTTCVTILPEYEFLPILFSEKSVRKIYFKPNVNFKIMQGNQLNIQE